MEVKAYTKNVKGSPRKARIVADVVRGQNALYAIEALRYMPKVAAQKVSKTIQSAVANAVHNHGMQAESLVVKQIMIDGGLTYKRMRAQSRGRGRTILKRTSNITVWVGDSSAVEVKTTKKADKVSKSADVTEAEVVESEAKKERSSKTKAAPKAKKVVKAKQTAKAKAK